VSTTLECSKCHTSFNSFSGGFFHKNTTTTTACANCHNGSVLGATGWNTYHSANPGSCDTCHKSTTTWSGAKMVHASTLSGTGCVACHPKAHHAGTNCLQCHTCNGGSSCKAKD
jgi:hypothetical protein